MSKRKAKKIISNLKKGCTVKEFLTLCNDMMFWFDNVLGTELQTVYSVLK